MVKPGMYPERFQLFW